MNDTPFYFTNSSSSYIGLLFSSNMNYLTTEVEQSIYDKCHHNFIYGKLNFDIPLPPPYYRKLWDYKKANIEGIKRAVSIFDWALTFKIRILMKKLKF